MKKLIIFIIVCITALSCGVEESQLDRTIFIPDENNIELPAYTEWGYNSFGAKYERAYFVASQKIIPCKMMYRNDSLYFLMDGVYGSSNQQEKMSLTFIFPLERIEDYNELIVMNNKKIDLHSGCTVIMTSDDKNKTLEIIRGELYFKRIQLLSVDDVINRVILSGTFELQFIGSNLFPESFSDGRFDFGITNKEFYDYSNLVYILDN